MRATCASLAPGSGAAWIAMSCGRTSAPSSRATGPRKPITNGFAGRS